MQFPGSSICVLWASNVGKTGYGARVFPDDTRKDFATVLSYLAGRPLSREEIWTAMELRRSTYYDQLEKGTLITADNLCTAARNLGINRAELLARYRFIEPEEIAALADEIRGHSALANQAHPAPTLTGVPVQTGRKRPTMADLRPRSDAPPL